ncbi:Ig-like domain repeat protein [Nocardioides sp.]|uniref:Ig-like domain repeat protein n=1 Tax=Nocardioides sp. TaxID=35761 RepID=UPI00262E0011|nr:Ig-like domain repeat protein [Nocardioides sp.]
MHVRSLLATMTVGAIATGACVATFAPAEAKTAPPGSTAGTVVTWGAAGASASTTLPPDLTAPVVDAAVNDGSTAVVTDDGKLKIWGDPTSPQEQNAPVGVTDAAAIALDPGAQGALLLHQDGSVTGWGALTLDLTTDAPTKAKAIAVSNGAAYAVTSTGDIVTWGSNTAANNPNAGVAPVPSRVTDNHDYTDVSFGMSGGLGLRTDGTVVAWGTNLDDQHTGDPANDPFNNLPTDLGSHKVVQISSGGYSDGLVLDDGTIRIWGYMPGILTPEQKTFPGKKVLSLTVGLTAAAVLQDTTTGELSTVAWGGVVGDADVATAPTSLAGKPVASVTMGGTHAAAIVTSFRALSKPSVSGVAVTGQNLQATPATFSLTPTSTPTSQWYQTKDGVTTALEGKTDPQLTVTEAMIGHTLSYRTTASYNGDSVTSASAETAVVTAPAPSTVKLTTTPASGSYGATRSVTATVAANGSAATGSVTFAIGSLKSTGTLAGGKATWKLPTSLAVGSHTVTATYAGNGATLGSNASTVVTVGKVMPSIAVKAQATGKTKKVAKKVTLTVTLRGVGKVSASGKVTITLKGKTKKTITITANSQGIAKVSFKKIKRGRYTVAVTYAGNTNVARATTQAKIKI